MKKFIVFLLVFLSCQFAWADLDSNFDYMNIPTEYFKTLKFKKTTLNEFKAKYLNFKLVDGMYVFRPKKGTYSEIRVGFNKNVLEWVEFILKDKVDLGNFLSRYGDVNDINRDYNETYDYYNYDSFNISADKQGEYLYSITVFDNPKLPDEFIGFDKKLPDWENLRCEQHFAPGEYLEESFSDEYDSIYPKFNEDGTKTYTIKDNITSKYSKVEFIFKDGLLKSLVLYPHSLTFDKISHEYGKNFKIDKTTKTRIVYDYGEFSVVSDLKNNVLQIVID